MRILHVGATSRGTTSLLRLEAMRALGHEVAAFDPEPMMYTGNRWIDFVRRRALIGPWIGKIDAAFVQAIKTHQPDLVWVDKGVAIRPNAIEAARQITRSPIVHYNPDDPFGNYRIGWKVFLKSLPLYDLHVVMRDPNVEEYRQNGARRVLRWYWAYDSKAHRPMDVSQADRQRLGGPVGFIGAWETPRAEAMASACRAGIPIRIWGPIWQHMKDPPELMKIEYRSLLGEDYARAVCAFDISLGFLRKHNRDQSTQRSVEIPACGAFMLAERTADHLALFEEGKEAEFFSSNDELIDKIRFYMSHDSQRKMIARAGLERCIRGQYDYESRLRTLFAQLRMELGLPA